MNEEYNDYENSERRCGMKEFIEKLISRLEEYKYSHLVEHDSEQCKHCEEKTYNECENMNCSLCIWDKATEIVNQLTEEYRNGWIPVSSGELPETKEIYLDELEVFCNTSDFVWVTLQNGKVVQANIEEDKWYSASGVMLEKEVIAWQPFIKPEPYQVEGE